MKPVPPPIGCIVTSSKLFGHQYRQVIGLCDSVQNGVVTIRMTHVMRYKGYDCHRPADKHFTNHFPALYTQALLEDVEVISAEARNALLRSA